MIILSADNHGSHIDVAVVVSLEDLATKDAPYIVRFDLDWEGDFYGRRIPQDIEGADRELIVAWSREVMRTTPAQLLADVAALTNQHKQPATRDQEGTG